MTNTTSVAYFLIICYALIERLLRKGKPALSLEAKASDRGSSRLLAIVSLFNLFGAVIAPVLNGYDIGYWGTAYVGWIGIVLMLIGLATRYSAARTLGEFYTRTLQILDKHCLVQTGLYRIIRHPGYLGTLLIGGGAGLAVNNWIVFLMALTTQLISKLYRIQVEEAMLQDELGEAYKNYAERTWRLIPYVY